MDQPLAKNRVEVDVCGVSLKILTTRDPEYIYEIANYFDSLFKRQFDKKPSQGVDLVHRLAMAGLNLSDELFKEREESAKREETLNSEAQNLKEELEAKKSELEEVKDKLYKMRNEFEDDIKKNSAMKRELDETKRQLMAVTKDLNECMKNVIAD